MKPKKATAPSDSHTSAPLSVALSDNRTGQRDSQDLKKKCSKCEYCDRLNKHGHLLFFYDGELIPDESIETKNGKALPGGWSQYELYLKGESVGWIESGSVHLTEEAKKKGFEFKEYEKI